MSYANLVNQSCASNAEAFQRLRDFICRRSGTYDYSSTGIGWTLHDAVYATNENSVAFGDYFVAYSPGEDGGQDVYLKVTYASGYINFHIYLYWNSATHAGVTAATTANNFTATNSVAITLWLYGDLDGIVLVFKISGAYHGCFATGRCPDSQFGTEVAISASAVAAGSDKVVTLGSVPASWTVGRNIIIRDTANIERVNISAISGNTVTLTTVVASYLAGCKLQGEVSSIVAGTTSFLSTSYALIAHSGTKSSSHSVDKLCGVSAATADGLVGGSPLSPVFYAVAASLIGPLPHLYRVSTSGRTAEATETDGAGTSYRYFFLGTNGVLIKEV